MDSPLYSQDEFDLNLPLHHHQLKEKFHFLLEKSIASTKGSPLVTPDQSVLDLKSTFDRKFRRIDAKKTNKKIDVLDENTRLFDMVSSNTSISNSKLVKNGFFHILKILVFLGKKYFEEKNRKKIEEKTSWQCDVETSQTW